MSHDRHHPHFIWVRRHHYLTAAHNTTQAHTHDTTNEPTQYNGTHAHGPGRHSLWQFTPTWMLERASNKCAKLDGCHTSPRDAMAVSEMLLFRSVNDLLAKLSTWHFTPVQIHGPFFTKFRLHGSTINQTQASYASASPRICRRSHSVFIAVRARIASCDTGATCSSADSSAAERERHRRQLLDLAADCLRVCAALGRDGRGAHRLQELAVTPCSSTANLRWDARNRFTRHLHPHAVTPTTASVTSTARRSHALAALTTHTPPPSPPRHRHHHHTHTLTHTHTLHRQRCRSSSSGLETHDNPTVAPWRIISGAAHT